MLIRQLISHSRKLLDKSIFMLLLRNFAFKEKTILCKSLFYAVLSPREMPTVRLCDYDCIGFDLDNTLLQYNITNLIKLQYQILTDYMVEKKYYNPKYLKKPLTEVDFDFMQKGLILDFERGNILKLDACGMIWRATHGTRLLTLEELKSVYPDQRWEISNKFTQDMLSTWNGELSMKIRALLDYFDMPVSIVFAKAVDTLDEENEKTSIYNIWPDILDGLNHMFSREQFHNNGDFFFALKSNPKLYLHLCSSETISWIKELKGKKKIFLITGSNIDFVDFTAGYALGKDWKSLFDIIICFAKKPGFFVCERPFLSIEGFQEKEPVTAEELEEGGIYSQGNWQGLKEFFARITGGKNPRFLYIGDNLIQDVYVPNALVNCDVIAVVDEQLAEKILHHELSHSDADIINSNLWGSYFSLKNPEGCKDSFWNHIIRNYSRVCIPKVDIISRILLDQSIECFDKNDNNSNGYYPDKPISLKV